MGLMYAVGFRAPGRELGTCTRVGRPHDNAMMVRGKDEHAHFELAELPERDTRPGETSTHAEALRRKAANILPKDAPSSK